MKRLKDYRQEIIDKAERDRGSDFAESVKNHMERVEKAFDEIHNPRNALIHGQPRSIASFHLRIGKDQDETPYTIPGEDIGEQCFVIVHKGSEIPLTEHDLTRILSSMRELELAVNRLRTVADL